MAPLLFFDIFSCSYIAILYLTIGINIKDINIMFTSMFNMIVMRAWISFSTDMITFTSNNTSFVIAIMKALIEMVLCYFIEDIYGYFIHRCMHKNKTLYKYVHQQHHETQAECFITAFNVHTVELIVFYFAGLLIGPVLLSKYWTVSFLGYNLWLCASTFFLIWSHTGLNIKWMPDTNFHNLHHKYYTVNYGTAFSDTIFGTARWK